MEAAQRVKLYRNAFEARRDAERAKGMRAYMRDQFEFLGLPTPVRRQAAKSIDVIEPTRKQLQDTAHALWELPQREYRYAALDLLARWKKLLTTADIPVLIKLANRQAWWDTVDGFASIIGKILLTQAKAGVAEVPLMEKALVAKSLWTRRIAMLHQLGWKQATDEQRLFRYALALAHEEDFFIRKAIGWALRDYARQNARAVRRFLATHGDQLSALSVREAGKHL
ncbi:MAG TPA: DNA alkylation repair protein [Candidatus Acidoferrum sp.]|nr:DNA alkylation repair protein [Candidatus Acidoferrum sp.]